MKKNQNIKTPMEINYRIQQAIEQMVSNLPNEKERAARSRRASKAITYGQYNLNELIAELNNIVKASGKWEATRVQGYRLKPAGQSHEQLT